MKQEIKNSMEQVKPWSKRAPWWILLVEGILALGLGIYALAAPDQAQGLVLLGIAIVLAFNGLLTIFGYLRGRREGNLSLIRGSIGLAVGAIVILMPVFNFGSQLTAAWILAIGLILAGVMAFLAVFMEAKATRWGNLLVAILFLVLGGVIVYNITTEASIVQIAAWVLVAFGLMLTVYSFFVRSSAAKGESTAIEPAKTAPASKPAQAQVAAKPAAEAEPVAKATEAQADVKPAADTAQAISSDDQQAQAQEPSEQ